ncbi:hypothetical protein SAMN06295970_14121 [Noviherbaspirillum suwonense]|uniref:Uncharacterized protein n=1 Tax=Noviherbaspirillum suwonense TaxID=1224511 RepID=A0ABY1QWB8_9BURK|nr:hypothetical protein SAMN06295970_14121 [Noviherbaspirillum suwonense]
MSWQLLASMFLLAFFPLTAKKSIDVFKQRKAHPQSNIG